MKKIASTNQNTLSACTQCNKIKLDGGNWIEDKFGLKKEARHRILYGVCPDCSHRLYPNLYKTPLRELYGS